MNILDVPLRDYLARCRRVSAEMQSRTGVWTRPAQLLKIYEEVGELHAAIKDKLGDDPLSYETGDIILSAISMFHVRGKTDEEIAIWLDKTIEKCERRAGL